MNENSSRPKILVVSASVCLVAAFFLTPELLIDLGPMRNSLTSSNDSVRDLALLEVMLAKLGLVLAGVLLVGFFIFWRRFIESSFYTYVIQYAPNRATDHVAYVQRCLNFSFFTILTSISIILVYIQFGPMLFSQGQLNSINGEDGVIENASALVFLSACLLSILLVSRIHNHSPKRFMHALLALVFFVMLGEEISWGQRLFGLESPEFFKQNNVQQEINLHNMYGYIFDHLFIAALFIWGSVLPLLSRVNLFFRNLFEIIGLPIASTGLAVGILLVTLFQPGVVLQTITPMAGLRVEEIRELLSAIALALIMLESLFSLSPRPSMTEAERGGPS